MLVLIRGSKGCGEGLSTSRSATYRGTMSRVSQRPCFTSCSCRLFPAFFSRSSGIGILHSHDHLTIHVSSESNRGYYHKREFEIPPYFYPLSPKFFCNLYEFIRFVPFGYPSSPPKIHFSLHKIDHFLKFPASAFPVLVRTVHIPLSLYRQCVFTSVRNKPMNISIERGACVSCGACWNICPELFNQNHCDSYSEVVENFRFNGDRAEGIVPDYLCCCAQEAVDLCPVKIIHVC